MKVSQQCIKLLTSIIKFNKDRFWHKDIGFHLILGHRVWIQAYRGERMSQTAKFWLRKKFIYKTCNNIKKMKDLWEFYGSLHPKIWLFLKSKIQADHKLFEFYFFINYFQNRSVRRSVETEVLRILWIKSLIYPLCSGFIIGNIFL